MRTEEEIYIGEVIGDQRDGKGKNIWINGDTCEGDWINGFRDGWLDEFWVDGSTYTGQYKKD